MLINAIEPEEEKRTRKQPEINKSCPTHRKNPILNQFYTITIHIDYVFLQKTTYNFQLFYEQTCFF